MTEGELHVLRIPSIRVTDLAEAIALGPPTVGVGIRPDGKLHEEMISLQDSPRTLERTDRYVVMPTLTEWGYCNTSGTPVPDAFAYTSDTNEKWLTLPQLQDMLAVLD